MIAVTAALGLRDTESWSFRSLCCSASTPHRPVDFDQGALPNRGGNSAAERGAKLDCDRPLSKTHSDWGLGKLRALTSSAGLWDGAVDMRRLRAALTPLLVGLAYFLRAAAAEAEPTAPPSTAVAESASVAPSPALAAKSRRLAGFDILASLGYGNASAKVGDLELQPYGASFGLDLGYTFRGGFRLGGVFGYGLGRAVAQRRDAIVGRDVDVTADTSMLNMATSLGWDVPVSFLVLRYTVNLGASVMWWSFGDTPQKLIFRNFASTSPTVGVFVAPGVTALWNHDIFRCGLGFDYVVQSNDAIPPAFLGELLVGVKL